VFFGETCTAAKVGWLGVIVAGVVELKLADPDGVGEPCR
jgi:multidrug transporter EmrE-like cation transporter